MTDVIPAVVWVYLAGPSRLPPASRYHRHRQAAALGLGTVSSSVALVLDLNMYFTKEETLRCTAPGRSASARWLLWEPQT